jgi:hypothetical protein
MHSLFSSIQYPPAPRLYAYVQVFIFFAKLNLSFVATGAAMHTDFTDGPVPAHRGRISAVHRHTPVPRVPLSGVVLPHFRRGCLLLAQSPQVDGLESRATGAPLRSRTQGHPIHSSIHPPIHPSPLHACLLRLANMT